jgi:hypothetical protein
LSPPDCGKNPVLQIGDKAVILFSAWKCKPTTFDPLTGDKLKTVTKCKYDVASDAIFGLQ